MRLLLGLLSTAAFSIASFVFVLSLFGIDALRLEPDLMWMHAAVMALFATVVVSGRTYWKRAPDDPDSFNAQMLRSPPWAIVFLVLLVTATALCIADMLIAGDGGYAAIIDGGYALEAKGKTLHPISAEQYDVQLLRQHRAAVGAWMVLLFLCVCWFLLRPPRQSQGA